MKKLLFIVLFLASNIVLLCSDTLSKSIHTDFFTFKRGYAAAYDMSKPHHEWKVKSKYPDIWGNDYYYTYNDSFEIKDPVLICAYSCIGFGGVTEIIDGYTFSAIDSISLEGSNVGKSNTWYYVFAERDDLSKKKIVLVYKPIIPFGLDTIIAVRPYLNSPFLMMGHAFEYGMKMLGEGGVALQPLKLSDINEDSDEFFKQIYAETKFIDKINWNINIPEELIGNRHTSLILFVGSFAGNYQGIEPNKPVWLARTSIGANHFELDSLSASLGQFKICYKYLEGSNINCSDESTSILEEIFGLTNANLYPNPAYKKVNIDFTVQKYTENLKMTIMNSIGQIVIVIKENKTYDAGKYSETINVDNLTAGTYYLIIETDYSSKKIKPFVVTSQ